jgi:hypothetical protein
MGWDERTSKIVLSLDLRALSKKLRVTSKVVAFFISTARIVW